MSRKILNELAALLVSKTSETAMIPMTLRVKNKIIKTVNDSKKQRNHL
jgi:hypothetical protein